MGHCEACEYLTSRHNCKKYNKRLAYSSISGPSLSSSSHERCSECDKDFRIKELEAELATYQEAKNKTCEYTIHIPTEEGYSDIEGRFYQCSCGASHIDISNTIEQDWHYCPYCGKPICSFETIPCIACCWSEFDGDSNYCRHMDGKYSGENTDDAYFDGCSRYEEAETVLSKQQ